MQKTLRISDEEKFHLAMKVKKMLENDKGILAADEKSSTLEPKFTSHGIANTEENRIKFRDCIFSTPELEKYIGGVILNEETFGQCNSEGVSLVQHLTSRNIEVGVKMDKGLMDFGSNEKISVGIEDLENRIREDKFKVASFCKWRSLFKISEHRPSDSCIEQNCIVLCKYAIIAQKHGKVPILEPEISIEGCYSIDGMATVAKKIYSTLFLWANKMNLFLPGILLKCSFITEGSRYTHVQQPMDVGAINVSVIAESVPWALGGVLFLSGGHSTEESFEILSLIHKYNTYKGLVLSFSFCRALTGCVLEVWSGNNRNIKEAQRRFLSIVKECNKSNRKNEDLCNQ
ncbi:uncharacterized protein VICG_01125 [Vittaforma corneae ATCC 50505]|uniref:fructose-bisphosphate aldolase n=1 Tax=Vittaforma corneae (strain ATCC 50505) TaxID=993615 RepID=L2GLK9_VITCO|nr:uncharacterized protein VICG_01125 [Vittaforma corneae ATCC 50505]ELA41773.1 hypothetical protein VICG_01125 [Vittaforma corneae ATCC 50505]